MKSEQSIPCPVCQTKIVFDSESLLHGHKFSCPNCSAVIGLAQESIAPTADMMEKYKQLKETAFTEKRNINISCNNPFGGLIRILQSDRFSPHAVR